MIPGDKKTFSLRTIIDKKGICFGDDGELILISGVSHNDENVYAEILEVHEKTIIAKKLLLGNPPIPEPVSNGYSYDDEGVDNNDDEFEEVEEELD